MKVKDSILQSATRGGIAAACVVALNSTASDEILKSLVKASSETTSIASPICFDEQTMVEEKFDVCENAVEDSAKDAELEKIFGGLVKKWKDETGFSSMTMRRYAHSSYQAILVLGGKEPKVVKLILEEMNRKPDMWFEALRRLTNEDPAKNAKSFDEAVKAWLDWGHKEKLIS